MTNADALLSRWDRFLGKLEERGQETLLEADEVVNEIIGSAPDDTRALDNALSGVRFRVEQLLERLEEVWSGDVEPALEAIGPATVDRGRDRRDDVKLRLEHSWQRAEAGQKARFYRALAARVAAAPPGDCPCGECGAPLSLATRAETLAATCESCGAVNQVMADRAAATARGLPVAVAEEEALPLRHELERFRLEEHRRAHASGWSPEPIASMERWLALERAYWQRFADARARAAGTATDPAFVDNRVRAFMEANLLNDQRWRRAKGMPM